MMLVVSTVQTFLNKKLFPTDNIKKHKKVRGKKEVEFTFLSCVTP